MREQVLLQIGIRSGLASLIVMAWCAAGPMSAQAQESKPEQTEAAKHRQELKEKYSDLQAEMKKLMEAGRTDQAAEVKEKLAQLRRELEAQPPRPEKEVREELRRERRAVGDTVGAPRFERAEAERRHNHLRAAIENLQAAGLPDLAERVGQEGKRIIAERPQSRIPAGMARPGPQIEQLRGELRELRNIIQNLERRLDQMGR